MPVLNQKTKSAIKEFVLTVLHWSEKVPVVLRVILGVVFVFVGAVFGFLPILGYWMVPLGLALLGLSFPWTRRRIHYWMRKTERELRVQSTSTSSQ